MAGLFVFLGAADGEERTASVCGIIGYVGQRACKPLLLQGLERLEYRGYDSAGLALLEADGLDYVRAVGNLQKLKQFAENHTSVSTTGVGHTRWATHGRVSLENAHPLTGCEDSAVAIVLNGIIENYRELKDSLLRDGHVFSSETDAEVVTHLIERHYEGDLVAAFRARIRAARGPLLDRRDPPRPRGNARRRAVPDASRRRRRRGRDVSRLVDCGIPARDAPRPVHRRPPDRGAQARGRDLPRSRGRDRRAAGDRDRLGRRARREVRVRDLHAQGDLRAAGGRAGDDRRPRPRPPADPGGHRAHARRRSRTSGGS